MTTRELRFPCKGRTTKNAEGVVHVLLQMDGGYIEAACGHYLYAALTAEASDAVNCPHSGCRDHRLSRLTHAP